MSWRKLHSANLSHLSPRRKIKELKALKDSQQFGLNTFLQFL